MNNDEFSDRLAQTFEAEDIALISDGEVFVRQIDRRIGRKAFARHAILTGVTLVGALVAGSQIPYLLLQMSAYGGIDLSMLNDTAEYMRAEPFSLLAVGFAALVSTVTLLSLDRI